MIDFQTYMLQAKQDSAIDKRLTHWQGKEAENASQTEIEELSETPELYLTPPQITGFNLRTKKWRMPAPHCSLLAMLIRHS